MTDYVIAAIVLAFIVVVLVLLKRAERRLANAFPTLNRLTMPGRCRVSSR